MYVFKLYFAKVRSVTFLYSHLRFGVPICSRNAERVSLVENACYTNTGIASYIVKSALSTSPKIK